MKPKQLLSMLVAAIRRACVVYPVTTGGALFCALNLIQAIGIYCANHYVTWRSLITHLCDSEFELFMFGTLPLFRTVLFCAGAVVVVRELAKGRKS